MINYFIINNKCNGKILNYNWKNFSRITTFVNNINQSKKKKLFCKKI